jgi:hypothetical protein
MEPKITREQIKVLVETFLSRQGFSVAKVEEAGNCQIFRAAARNGAVIGSVTIPPGILELPVSEAQKYVAGIVLDMCRACASEPAGRGA